MSKQTPRSLTWISIALLGCMAVHADPDTIWPTQRWPVSTPAGQGVDAAVLEALDREFAAGAHGYIDGMLVIRNGHVVYERSYPQDYDAPFEGHEQDRGPYNYYDPEWHPYYQRGELHSLQSVSKSVTSALIGIAIGDGAIPDVTAPLERYLIDYPAPDQDPRRRNMTLDDVLTMQAGIRWDESTVTYTDPANSCARMEASRDWVAYVRGLPMAVEPGSGFLYNSGATVLLDQVLWQATGKHAMEFARERLFAPLGIKGFYWKQTPAGQTDTEGGLYLTPRDLARFGYLYARDGVWEGQRILPEGWVEASMRPSVSAGEGWAYGYQWWLPEYAGGSRTHGWMARGYGGQLLLILPEYDTVAVFTGWNIYDRPSLSADLVLDRILAAVR